MQKDLVRIIVALLVAYVLAGLVLILWQIYPGVELIAPHTSILDAIFLSPFIVMFGPSRMAVDHPLIAIGWTGIVYILVLFFTRPKKRT